MRDANDNQFAEESRRWHAAARQRDVADIASGQMTAAEVNQRNAFILNASEWKDVNLGEVLNDLYEEDDAIEVG